MAKFAPPWNKMPDADYDTCDDALDETKNAAAAATTNAPTSLVANNSDIQVSNKNPLTDEAVFTTAVLAEEAAIEVESVALSLVCSTALVENATALFAGFSEYTAKIAEQASEQATKAGNIAKGNFLMAYAEASDLAAKAFRNLSDEAEDVEAAATHVADGAATTALAFHKIAATTNHHPASQPKCSSS